MSKIKIRKLILLGFWPLGLLLSWVTVSIPYQVEEYYSRVFSRIITRFLSVITGLLPFSLAELTVWLVAIGLIIRMVWLIKNSFIDLAAKKYKQVSKSNSKSFTGCFTGYRKKDKKRTGSLLSFFYSILVLSGIIYFSFVLIWGINYNRLSFAEIAGLHIEGSSVQELEELCGKLITRANTLRLDLNEDQQGVMKIEGEFQSVRDLSSEAYIKAEEVYPELGGEFGRPKPVFFSKLMAYTGISGIYSPFTGEANVNIDIPDSMLPATTCHEMAHQRGFAREDEANYIAWVVCNSSDVAEFRYSGTLSALIYAMNALSANAPDQADLLKQNYSVEVQRDLQDISQYWKKHQGKLEEVTSDINDAYLKSNRQEDGVQSYGRMVDLLLAEQKAEKSKRFLP